MWKRNLRIVKKYQWLYLTKLISVKLREAPTNKNMFKFAENTFIYSLIKTLFSSSNVQRLLVKYFPKQELTYILSSLKIHSFILQASLLAEPLFQMDYYSIVWHTSHWDKRGFRRGVEGGGGGCPDVTVPEKFSPKSLKVGSWCWLTRNSDQFPTKSVFISKLRPKSHFSIFLGRDSGIELQDRRLGIQKYRSQTGLKSTSKKETYSHASNLWTGFSIIISTIIKNMKETLAGNHEYALLTISHICNDNHYPASGSLMMEKQQEQLII